MIHEFCIFMAHIYYNYFWAFKYLHFLRVIFQMSQAPITLIVSSFGKVFRYIDPKNFKLYFNFLNV